MTPLNFVAQDAPDDFLPPPQPIGPADMSWTGSNLVSNDLKAQWTSDGFLVLRGVYSAQEIADYNRVVAEFRSTIDDGKDEYGFGDRVGQLHQKFPELLNMATSSRVLSFLKWAFNDEPIVFGSLNFDRGTQQDAHIDAIFFWPEPAYSMAGCWVALEDVHPDSGPLFYVPNSHTWPFFRSEHVVASRPELAAQREVARRTDCPAEERAAVVGSIGVAWTEDFKSLEQARQSERPTLSLQAGDVVLWHSLLAHGGSPRINPSISRRSVVFHYIGKNTSLYSFDDFMLYDEVEFSEIVEQPKNIGNFAERVEYMRYPYYVTYPKTGQIMHPLDN